MMQDMFPSKTHKTEHLRNIQQETNIPFNSMLLFDDELWKKSSGYFVKIYYKNN